MSFGEFLGKMYNSYLGPDENGDPSRRGLFAQSLGAGYDYLQARKQTEEDEQLADRAMAQRQAISQQQLAIAQQRAAEEAAIRGGIVNRSQMLEQAINQARSAMGQFNPATQGDINTNYQQIRDMMVGDLESTIDRVSSQGYADAISKGMDRSDRFRDEKRDLSKEYADQLRKIDQEAYNAAINRTQSNQNLLSSGRDLAYKDIGAGYQTTIDNLKGAMPTTAASSYGNAMSSARDIGSDLSARATDSQKASGTMQAGLDKKYAGNIGFMLGRDDNYTSNTQTELDAANDRIAALEAQLPTTNKPR